MRHEQSPYPQALDYLKVSVCIPAYNAAETIEKCLESILKQTIEAHEILIVDGHSQDDTLKIAQKYPKVRVIGFAKGIGKARKILSEKATGDIIAWVDADVVIPPNWLELHLKIHSENREIMILSGRWRAYGDHSGTITLKQTIPNVSCEMKPIGESTLTQNACSMKKEVFSVVNYDERFRVSEDWDFATSAHIKGIRSFFCDGLLYFHIRRRVTRKFRVRYAIYSGNTVLFLKKYGLWFVKYDPRSFVSFIIRIAMLYALPLSIFLSPFALLVYPAAWFTHSIIYKMPAHPFTLLMEMIKSVGEHLYLLKIL